MKGATTGMNDTAYKKTKRGADMLAWVNATAPDNEEALERLHRALRHARGEALTERQRELLELHYEAGMGVSDIARTLGVNRSTVSRTLTRARRRLYERLRYTA